MGTLCLFGIIGRQCIKYFIIVILRSSLSKLAMVGAVMGDRVPTEDIPSRYVRYNYETGKYFEQADTIKSR